MKIHTIPFHIGDWMGGTLGWDALECGAYFNLLVVHYQIGPDGLPDDDKLLARFARVSPKVWLRISLGIKSKFTKIGQRLVSQKVSKVCLKCAQKSSNLRYNALKRHDVGDADASESNIQNPESRIHAAKAAGQQGKKKDRGGFTEAEIKAAMPDSPAFNPEATSSDVLPGGWCDSGISKGVPYERIYASWRRFKIVTSSPYQKRRWVAWLGNESCSA